MPDFKNMSSGVDLFRSFEKKIQLLFLKFPIVTYNTVWIRTCMYADVWDRRINRQRIVPGEKVGL